MLCLKDLDFHFLTAKADHLIQRVENDGTEEEVLEKWRLNKAAGAVHDHEDVQDDVSAMGGPEGHKEVTAGVLGGKGVDDNHLDGQQYTCHTCKATMSPELTMILSQIQSP